MSLYNWNLRPLIACGRAELDGLRPLVESMALLSGKARREGLISLENELAGAHEPLFQSGLRLTIDGIDPELLRIILENRIVLAGETGAALRRSLILLEGILCIQRGAEPDLVRDILGDFLLPAT